jgi:2-keto-4-pentenoate hydratase
LHTPGKPTPGQPADTPQELATSLWRQHRERARFESIADFLPSMQAAYAVQDALVRLMIPSEGTPAGYKIGLTSLRMREMCGLDEPVAGVILGRRVHRSAARVAARDFVLRIDGQLADRGNSADALTHPFALVQWLADHLRSHQRYLRAGDLVMTGSIVTTRFAKTGEHYRFELTGLPPAELWVT